MKAPPEAAREIIETQPKVSCTCDVFAGRRTGLHFSGSPKAKRQSRCEVRGCRLEAPRSAPHRAIADELRRRR